MLERKPSITPDQKELLKDKHLVFAVSQPLVRAAIEQVKDDKDGHEGQPVNPASDKLQAATHDAIVAMSELSKVYEDHLYPEGPEPAAGQ